MSFNPFAKVVFLTHCPSPVTPLFFAQCYWLPFLHCVIYRWFLFTFQAVSSTYQEVVCHCHYINHVSLLKIGCCTNSFRLSLICSTKFLWRPTSPPSFALSDISFLPLGLSIWAFCYTLSYKSVSHSLLVHLPVIQTLHNKHFQVKTASLFLCSASYNAGRF